MVKARKRTIKTAKTVLDGIVTITKAEQLIHGDYVTHDVINEDLKGALCGGHGACLLGSAAIAHPTTSRVDLATYFEWEDILENRPALELAARALDKAAFERLAKARNSRARGLAEEYEWRKEVPGRFAESYFETYLGRHSVGKARSPVRNQVISLCSEAKKLLKSVSA